MEIKANTKLLTAAMFSVGFLMPIDYINPIPPIAFDILRYGIASALIFVIYSQRRKIERSYFLGLAAFLLITTGTVSVVKAIVLGGSLLNAATVLISPLVAFLVIRPQIHHRTLLIGFTIGCSLSAIDAILQASGLPFFGIPSADGFRFSGFSLSSTSFAPLLAVAISIAGTPWAWNSRHTILRFLLLVPLIVALFISQGRGGLACLIVALCILLANNFSRKPGPIIVFSVIGAAIFLLTNALELLLDYILRTDGPGSGDISSGRTELNEAAWNAFWHNGVFGIAPDIRGDYNPHLAVLSAALNTGVIGFISTFLVCIFLLILVFSFFNSTPILFRMIAGIALTVALIEPSGFFVGFTGSILVMLCFSHFKPSTPHPEQLTVSTFAKGN